MGEYVECIQAKQYVVEHFSTNPLKMIEQEGEIC